LSKCEARGSEDQSNLELSTLPQLVRMIVQPEILFRLPHYRSGKICSDNRNQLQLRLNTWRQQQRNA
jgi:hypothetical protein